MPQMTELTSIAALTTTNVCSGKLFERIGARPARIRVYACTTTAASLGEVTATMYVGSEVIAQDAVLSVDAAGMKTDQHLIAQGVALPGDQLKLDITNSHATTARVPHWLIDIQPV